MKGIIIDEGEKYFTFLKKIFKSINDVQKKYNWLITSYECYPQNTKYVEKLSEEYCWITGEDLTEMVEKEDFQWVWGVFSAFSKDVTEEEILQYKLPRADGYDGFWKSPVSIQHPLAEIEIVAWDSSLTIFISKDNAIADGIIKNNPLAKDLEEYNKEM